MIFDRAARVGRRGGARHNATSAGTPKALRRSTRVARRVLMRLALADEDASDSVDGASSYALQETTYVAECEPGESRSMMASPEGAFLDRAPAKPARE